MKSLMIFVLTGLISVSALAKNETSSFKTASNQTVMIGDSLTQLINRTGQSPSAMKSVPWVSNGNTIFAMQYDYQIGDNIYSVTVVEEQIRKIEMQSSIQ